jgi:hypothetical protein
VQTMRIGCGVNAFDAYLTEIANALHGPRQWKMRVLDEVADGLLSELEGVACASEVIRRWGPPDKVAAEFNVAGCLVRARRMACQVLQWLPVLIVGWALVVELSPDPWPSEPVLIRWLAPLLFTCVVVTVAGAARLSWRLTPGAGARTGIAAVFAGVSMGVTCIAVLLMYRIEASDFHVFWPGVCASGTVTLGFLALVASDMRHLLGSAALSG